MSRKDDVACAGIAESTDAIALIRRAHQHWFNIGWPEDSKPIAMLERAMELLDPEKQLARARDKEKT